MKSTQFTIDFLEKRKRAFTESDFRQFLPVKPYEDVLDDLEALKLTEAVLGSKNLQELIKVLERVNYLYLPEPTPIRDILIDLEIIVDLNSDRLNFIKVNSILKRLPVQYGLKAKMYELLCQL